MTKSDCKDTTILFPGGFKPLTGAHLDLIKRYTQHPNVKRVVLFMSPSKRDGIEVDVAFKIAKDVLRDLPVDIVLDKNSYSPILAIYRWIQESSREKGNYALAASSKDRDYDRVKEFVKNYTPERFGNNLPIGVKVIELMMDTHPLNYKDGQPISSTSVRQSIKDNNFNRFKESYPNLSDDKITYIWKSLKP